MNSIIFATTLTLLTVLSSIDEIKYELTATNFNKSAVYVFNIQHLFENETHKVFKTHKNACLLKENVYESTRERLIFKNFIYEDIKDYLNFNLSSDQWCYITLEKIRSAHTQTHAPNKTKNLITSILSYTLTDTNKSRHSFRSPGRRHNLKNQKRYNRKSINKRRLIKRVYY